MKKFTFSGMSTCTARFDFDVTVTPKDIAKFEASLYEPEFTLEDVEAWTDEQVRAYVEEHMLEGLVEEVAGGGHVYETYYEYDDDMMTTWNSLLTKMVKNSLQCANFAIMF
jgi:hypothetical protein